MKRPRVDHGPQPPPGLPASIVHALRNYAARITRCDPWSVHGYDADDFLAVGFEAAAAVLEKGTDCRGLALTVAKRRIFDRFRALREMPRHASPEWARAAKVAMPARLDKRVLDETGSSTTVGDLIGRACPILSAVEDREAITSLFARAFAGLWGRDRQRYPLVVLLHDFEGRSFREIGATLGLSESRACQLHTNAMQRLRAAATNEQWKARAS